MSYRPSVSLCRPAATSGTPHATTSPKLVYPPVHSSPRCCENGRPVMADPLTGSTVCSCQFKTGLPAYLSRVPSLPETVYGTGTSPMFQPNVVVGNDASSAFYQMSKLGHSDSTKTAPSTGHPAFYLDPLLASHPYGAFYPGFDLNSARRKNATRETTSALKAWLYEHRKNPYPTKGEKIMLAIITRMTMTQVSTWFANARRRLKKENKYGDKDGHDCLDDIDIEDTSDSGRRSSITDDNLYKDSTDISDISDSDDASEQSQHRRKTATIAYNGNDFISQHDIRRNEPAVLNKSSAEDLRSNSDTLNIKNVENKSENQSQSSLRSRNSIVARTTENNSRPRIWSITDMIGRQSELTSSINDSEK